MQKVCGPGGPRSNPLKFALVTCIALLAACSRQVSVNEEPERCTSGEPRLVAQMFFGRNVGDHVGVSDADWARFVDTEITPRFPAGLTVFDAQGQWRDTETGRIVREPSKAVLLILDDQTQGRARIDEVVQVYRTRFHQQAVGVVAERSCVSF